MNEGEWFSPYWGILLLKLKIGKPFVDKLLKEGNKSREKNLDASDTLAGVIKGQFYYKYDYEKWFLPRFNEKILSVYEEKLKDFQPEPLTNKGAIKFPLKVVENSLWINYQRCKEYNPPHKHDGDLSFVIYLQVPKGIVEEDLKEQGKSKKTYPGRINFFSGTNMPFSINSYSELPEVGDVFIFPSYLMHFVNPFESEGERISVAGNIYLETNSTFLEGLTEWNKVNKMKQL